MPRKPKDCGIDKRKRAARQIAELEQRIGGAARQATRPPRAPRPPKGTAGALAIANTRAPQPNSPEPSLPNETSAPISQDAAPPSDPPPPPVETAAVPNPNPPSNPFIDFV